MANNLDAAKSSPELAISYTVVCPAASKSSLAETLWASKNHKLRPKARKERVT